MKVGQGEVGFERRQTPTLLQIYERPFEWGIVANVPGKRQCYEPILPMSTLFCHLAPASSFRFKLHLLFRTIDIQYAHSINAGSLAARS